MDVVKKHFLNIEARLSEDSSLRALLSGRIKLKFTNEEIDNYVIGPFSPYVLVNGDEFDAHVELPLEYFEKIILQNLNPQKAFVDGKIKVSGDTMLVLNASSLLFDKS